MQDAAPVGIGAILRAEENGVLISSLVPGGPAATSGALKAGDRIVAVADANQEFVPVDSGNLEKVISLVRGKAGTIARLKVAQLKAEPRAWCKFPARK